MERFGSLLLVPLSDQDKIDQCISTDPHLVLSGIQHAEGSQQTPTTPLVDAVDINGSGLALCVREGLQEVIINRRTGDVRVEVDGQNGDTAGMNFNSNTTSVVLTIIR